MKSGVLQKVTKGTKAPREGTRPTDPERELREAIDLRKALYEGSMGAGFEFVPTPGCGCELCQEVIANAGKL